MWTEWSDRGTTSDCCGEDLQRSTIGIFAPSPRLPLKMEVEGIL